MKKVFIGVGHGGTDPGAVANGLKEANLNLQMALELQRQLERHGVNTAISRTKDENDPLSEEIAEANAYRPDLAIDVHNNAGGGDGLEVLVQTNKYKEQSRAAAQAIEAATIAIGQNSRGIKTKLNSSKTDYFGFLRQVNAPAVIVEGAFVDNKNDAAQVDELHEQKAFGKAYAKGILKYFGIDWKEESTAGSETTKPPKEDSKTNYPEWQTSGLAALAKAGVITDSDYWKGRFNQAVTVGELVGILGKMLDK